MKNKQNYPSSKASGSQRGQMPGKLSGKITGQLLPQTVLDAVLASRQPLKVEELMAGLGLEKKNRKRLLNLLADLLEAEDLLYLPGGRYAAADQLKQIIGRLEVQRSGMGFVISKDPSLKGKDVYISSAHLARAWTGDTVKVGLLPDQRGKSPEGIILKVLKRKLKNILVRVVRQSAPGEVLCTPLDSRYANAVLADTTSLSEQFSARTSSLNYKSTLLSQLPLPAPCKRSSAAPIPFDYRLSVAQSHRFALPVTARSAPCGFVPLRQSRHNVQRACRIAPVH